jgi:hypothetical protein
MRLIRSIPVFALAAASCSMLFASSAFAAGNVSPTGKGITGGALLGGEAVMLTEAAVGVKPGWAYLVGGVAGAAGGGVGGYFVEKASSAKPSLYLLAGGMALIIPTTVAVLSATAYHPPENYTEDHAPAPGEPVAEPPQATSPPAVAPATGTAPATSPAPATGPAPAKPGARRNTVHRVRLATYRSAAPLTLYQPTLPPALFGLDPGGLKLSVPAVEVSDLYNQREVQQFGVKQGTEVDVPVFNFTF